VMPMWPFEPDGGSADGLVSAARFWGVDILVEARRIEDHDDPTPVPSVRQSFRRGGTGLNAGSGAGRPPAGAPSTRFLPGSGGRLAANVRLWLEPRRRPAPQGRAVDRDEDLPSGFHHTDPRHNHVYVRFDDRPALVAEDHDRQAPPG
jgi:hypothetical protein